MLSCVLNSRVMSFEKYLERIYYDPRHSGSFGGVDKLYRAVRKEGKYVLGRAKIRKWMETQETFGLHRQINRKFKRQRVISPYIDYQWDADTAVMKTYAKANDGYGYFLLIIDVFSKFVWTRPLKSTKGIEMCKALESVFVEGRTPEHLRTDKGSEYHNRDVAKLLRKRHIEHFFSLNTEIKAGFSERSIKTIKKKLSRYMSRHQTHRWIDVLESITESYNASYHRSIKMAPKKVTKKDEVRLWKLQYRSKPKTVTKANRRFAFKKGDTVRISHLRRPFDREYDERWTMEYFVVDKRGKKQEIAYYVLKDIMGDPVQGTFYQSELSRVKVTDHTLYRIEKVLRRKRGESLVKWMGWPAKFNSWMPNISLKDYKKTKTHGTD